MYIKTFHSMIRLFEFISSSIGHTARVNRYECAKVVAGGKSANIQRERDESNWRTNRILKVTIRIQSCTAINIITINTPRISVCLVDYVFFWMAVSHFESHYHLASSTEMIANDY